MAKLGPVPPPPAPVDPFKNQAPPSIGVVPSVEVTAPAAEPEQPKIGVVTKRPTVIVNLPPQDLSVQLGPVAPAVTPAPAAAASQPAMGVVTDETPVYPPPPPEKKPDLGTIRDISITPPAPPPEETIGEVPLSSQPVVVDPFKKDE